MSKLDQPLLIEQASPCAVLTLNRPDRRNALSLGLMRDLVAGLRQVSADPGVQVVILRANGPVFSAGHYLSELVGGDNQLFGQIFDTCVELMETIQAIPQPVIAEVARVSGLSW